MNAVRLTVGFALTAAVMACDLPMIPLAPPADARPASTPGDAAWFWAIVIAQGGGGDCIVGARVEIVAGQAIGQSRTMPVCNVWSEDGAFFMGLTVGVEMTVRASAPGYLAQEIAVMPTSGGQMATVIHLPRIQTP